MSGDSCPPLTNFTRPRPISTATGSNTVLEFAAENPPDNFGLDDVTTTPIPTPSFAAATRNNHSLSLTWYSVSNVNYQVLCSTNLAQTNWVALSTNTATGATLTITNPLGAEPQRFYRIRRLP